MQTQTLIAGTNPKITARAQRLSDLIHREGRSAWGQDQLRRGVALQEREPQRHDQPAHQGRLAVADGLTDGELLAEILRRGVNTPSELAKLGRALGLRGACPRSHRRTNSRPGVWSAAIALMREPAGATQPQIMRRLLDQFIDRTRDSLAGIVTNNLYVLRTLAGGALSTQAHYRFRWAIEPRRGTVYRVDGGRDCGRDSVRAEISRIIGRSAGATIDEAAWHLQRKYPHLKDRQAHLMVTRHVSVLRSLAPAESTEATFIVTPGDRITIPVFRVL